MDPTSGIAKDQEKSDELKIEVDVNLVDMEISKNNFHKTENMTFVLFDPNKMYTVKTAHKNAKYIAELKDAFSYVGILDENLDRQVLGLNTYPSNDIYFGEWKDDKRQGNGVYIYTAKEDKVDIFWGEFKEGKKNGQGLYLWKQAKDPYSALDERCDYDVSIGKFNDSSFTNEITFSQSHVEGKLMRYLYKGQFLNGKKNDDNAMYLEYESKKVFLGKIENDVLISGYLVKTSEDMTNAEELYHFTKKDQDDYEFKREDDVSKEEQEKIKKTVVEFLNSIQEKKYLTIGDCFDDLLSEVKKFYDRESFLKDHTAITARLREVPYV